MSITFIHSKQIHTGKNKQQYKFALLQYQNIIQGYNYYLKSKQTT